MPDNFWENIAETSWWVYVLLFYFLWLGVQATKPRTVLIRNLLILPFFALGLSIVLFFFLKVKILDFCIWLAALITGTLLGWLQFRFLKIKIIEDKKKIQVPGSWSLLIVIIILFIAKFYLGMELNFNSQILFKQEYASGLMFLYGLFTGLFIGRVLPYFL